jgi:hypothetical protein
MERVTLSVPTELKKDLEEAGFNLSELFRAAAMKRLNELKLAKALEKLVEDPENLGAEAAQLATEIKAHPNRFANKGETLLKLLGVVLKHSKLSEEEADRLAVKLGRQMKKGRFDKLKEAGLA